LDLTSLYDDQAEPAYLDYTHPTPFGARIAADRIARELDRIFTTGGRESPETDDKKTSDSSPAFPGT
jgi:hypothetical protein